jgi:hypothetical protein
MATAPEYLPIAGGEPRRTLTDPAPADSPMIVILFGSPPKDAMFLIVHCLLLVVSRMDWEH